MAEHRGDAGCVSPCVGTAQSESRPHDLRPSSGRFTIGKEVFASAGFMVLLVCDSVHLRLGMKLKATGLSVEWISTPTDSHNIELKACFSSTSLPSFTSGCTISHNHPLHNVFVSHVLH